MTEVVVLQQSPSHFSSTSSSSSSSTKPCAQNDEQSPRAHMTNTSHIQEEEEEEEEICRKERERYQQVSVVELLLAAFRKSVIGPCSAIESRDFCSPSSSSSGSGSGSSSRRIMEIGWPSNVRHIAHVTFDRFNGFLGLPDDFEPQVPRRPPSASANVFGVSTESMQLSFDSRGNSVPTILLMMQRHLYAHGGLQIEGIFRINGGNSQEEYVRDQLNSGVIPNDIDIHCLAGLIKAWFRELPRGLLDTISPEQVMQSQSEEECVRLVRLLPPAEAALLDWAVNLMADVSQFEHANKMNPRNIAMVFAPNMTQMADPLTALMYAVQVMNFLKTLIIKTLREREDTVVEASPEPRLGASGEDDDAHHQALSSQPNDHDNNNNNKQQEIIVENEKNSPSRSSSSTITTTTGGDQPQSFLSSIENIIPSFESVGEPKSNKSGQLSASSSLKRSFRKKSLGSSQKNKKTGILGRINSRKELVEAWR